MARSPSGETQSKYHFSSRNPAIEPTTVTWGPGNTAIDGRAGRPSCGSTDEQKPTPPRRHQVRVDRCGDVAPLGDRPHHETLPACLIAGGIDPVHTRPAM